MGEIKKGIIMKRSKKESSDGAQALPSVWF